MATQDAEGQTSRIDQACEVTYDKAAIEYFEFKNIRIPVADLHTMIKTKLGIRPKDMEDKAFLMSILV